MLQLQSHRSCFVGGLLLWLVHVLIAICAFAELHADLNGKLTQPAGFDHHRAHVARAGRRLSCSMSLAPLLSCLLHASPLQRRRAPTVATTAAAGRQPQRPRNSNRARTASVKRRSAAQDRASRQPAAAADAEPVASADALAAGLGRVNPPQPDAAAPQDGSAISHGGSPQPRRRSKASKWQNIVAPVSDGQRNVAAIAGILGGMQQDQAPAAVAAIEAAAPAPAESTSPAAVDEQQEAPQAPGTVEVQSDAAGAARLADAGSVPAAVDWQVPAAFRPATAAAIAGGKPTINEILAERKFEKKVRLEL